MSGTTSPIGFGPPNVQPNETPRPGEVPRVEKFGDRLAEWLGLRDTTAARDREPAAGNIAQLLEAARELTARIRGLLGERGIDTGSDLRLALDGVGRFRVASPHPRATEIEVVLAAEPEVGDELRALAERIASHGLDGRAAELGLPTTAEIDGETFVKLNVPPLVEDVG